MSINDLSDHYAFHSAYASQSEYLNATTVQDATIALVRIPQIKELVTYFRHLSVPQLRQIAFLHNINIPPALKKAHHLFHLIQHTCNSSCSDSIYVFKELTFDCHLQNIKPITETELVQQMNQLHKENLQAHLHHITRNHSSVQENSIDTFPYFASDDHCKEIIREWQDEVTNPTWSIKPCAVCRQNKKSMEIYTKKQVISMFISTELLFQIISNELWQFYLIACPL
jgi:hypothetical protein